MYILWSQTLTRGTRIRIQKWPSVSKFALITQLSEINSHEVICPHWVGGGGGGQNECSKLFHGHFCGVRTSAFSIVLTCIEKQTRTSQVASAAVRCGCDDHKVVTVSETTLHNYLEHNRDMADCQATVFGRIPRDACSVRLVMLYK